MLAKSLLGFVKNMASLWYLVQSLMNLLNKRCMGFGWLSMYYGMRCLIMLVGNNGMLAPVLRGSHRGHRCT